MTEKIPSAADSGGNTVPLGQKLAWGTGAACEVIVANAMNALALPIYNIALGVSPVLIGWAIAIPRVWDSIIDPIIGNLSDNTQTRWGRRRPWIFAGAILSSLLFAVVWMPPTRLGHAGLFTYFLIVSILYFFAYAVFVIPYNALGYELSTDYHERTRVMGWRSFFMSVGGLPVSWLYWLSLRPIFGGNEVVGIRYVAVLVAILVLGLGLTPAIFCRERYAHHAQAPVRLLDALRLTVRNRPYLIVVGIVFTVIVAIFLVIQLPLYINIYYVCGGNKDFASALTGYGGFAYNGIAILSVWPLSKLSSIWGKRATLMAGLWLVAAGFLASWWLYDPRHPYLQLVVSLIQGAGTTCMWILTGSMLADVCDADELESGRRREGVFGAVYAMTFKLGYAAVTIISGYVLKLTGYVEGATQSVQTMTRLRLVYAVAPALLMVGAVVLLSLYPITESRMREIRRLLEERKASSAEP